jgi:hypothetical protein
MDVRKYAAISRPHKAKNAFIRFSSAGDCGQRQRRGQLQEGFFEAGGAGGAAPARGRIRRGEAAGVQDQRAVGKAVPLRQHVRRKQHRPALREFRQQFAHAAHLRGSRPASGSSSSRDVRLVQQAVRQARALPEAARQRADDAPGNVAGPHCSITVRRRVQAVRRASP